MLMRMYMRWAETNGYKVSVANLQDGDEAVIKTVTMNIEGSFSYGYLTVSYTHLLIPTDKTNSCTAGGIAAPAVGKKRPFSMPIVFFDKL